jgi:hypothetical protein
MVLVCISLMTGEVVQFLHLLVICISSLEVILVFGEMSTQVLWPFLSCVLLLSWRSSLFFIPTPYQMGDLQMFSNFAGCLSLFIKVFKFDIVH